MPIQPAGPGEWKHLYRAVDYQGYTVDFLLSGHGDIEAAKQFFTRAIERCGAPEKITVDAYPATHIAIAKMKGKFRGYGKLCWLHKIAHNIAGACTLFEICTATL